MANIFDVANYFIVRSCQEQGDEADITILKLQRLCYYAQGVHLATQDRPLFDDEILAWVHSPVVFKLHKEFDGNRSTVLAIPNNITLNDINLTLDEKQTVEDVYTYFGQFSSWKLRNMIYQETPWLKTKRNTVINIELIKKYFKENIVI